MPAIDDRTCVIVMWRDIGVIARSAIPPARESDAQAAPPTKPRLTHQKAATADGERMLSIGRLGIFDGSLAEGEARPCGLRDAHDCT